VRREATLTGFVPDVDLSQELNVFTLSNLVAKDATGDVSVLPEFSMAASGEARNNAQQRRMFQCATHPCIAFFSHGASSSRPFQRIAQRPRDVRCRLQILRKLT
jgi:hypothetical protein